MRGDEDRGFVPLVEGYTRSMARTDVKRYVLSCEGDSLRAKYIGSL